VKRTKIFSRRTRPDKSRTAPDRSRMIAGQAPRWVGWFTDVGRPLSAVVVMVLCAPGERHLAELAGWGPTLSWGMAGLLVMYAGIAAVVATVRPKGAPGKRTAVLGAILSLLLAMAAQPVSHYFVTGWMSAQPRPPFWLVTVVSCVPPFVMGHLLHLAADPGNQPEDGDSRVEEVVARYEAAYFPAPEARPEHECSDARDEAPQFLTDSEADAEGYPHGTYIVNTVCADCGAGLGTRTVFPSGGAGVPPEDEDIPVIPPEPSGDSMHWTPDTEESPDRTVPPAWLFGADSSGPVEVPSRTLSRTAIRQRIAESSGTPDAGQGEAPDTVREIADSIIALAADTGHRTPDVRIPRSELMADGQRTPDTFTGRTAGDYARELWRTTPELTGEAVRAAVRAQYPDMKADAVRKAVKRAEQAVKS
jgi:hypothetical protein